LKINYRNFIFFSSLGTLTWSFIFITLGIILGENWQNFALFYYFIHNFLVITLIILVLALLYFIFYKPRRKKNL